MSQTAAALHTRSCPICGADNTDTPPGRYSRDGWVVVACRGCGFVHLRDVPVTAALQEDLAWEKTFATEAKRRRVKHPFTEWLDRSTRWRLHLFRRVEGADILNREAPAGPAIELGCGSGGHLMTLEERFTPYGVEISRQLAAAADASARARGGAVVQASSADGLARFADGFFTAALLRSYLEHDWQARDVLRILHTKMAPGGLAVVKVPNFGSINRRLMGRKWVGFRLPDHVNYFDPRSLTRLATEAGFRVRIPPLLALPTDDNMLAVLSR